MNKSADLTVRNRMLWLLSTCFLEQRLLCQHLKSSSSVKLRQNSLGPVGKNNITFIAQQQFQRIQITQTSYPQKYKKTREYEFLEKKIIGWPVPQIIILFVMSPCASPLLTISHQLFHLFIMGWFGCLIAYQPL